MAFLTSENRRLKARLAAASGDEDLYAFLTKNGDANTDYVQDLQRRLRLVIVALLKDSTH